jgi:hypothetical protein
MSAFNQDDLIAYHLHELPWHRARALRRALRTDPVLASESDAIAATLLAFPKDEAAPPLAAAARDKYWLALLPALAAHAPKVAAPRSLFPRTPLAHSLSHGWHLAAIAGTAIVASTLFLSLHHHRRPLPAPSSAIGSSTPPEATSETIHTLPPSQLANNTLFASAEPDSHTPRPLFPTRTQPPLTASLAPASPSTVPQPAPSFLSTPVAPTTPAAPPPAPSTTASIQPQTAAAQTPANSSATPLPSQPAASQQSIRAGKSHASHLAVYHPHITDVSLAIFADLTAADTSPLASGTGSPLITQTISQTASPAVGALASFHQQLRPWLGYRITATYFHPTFEYLDTYSNSGGAYATGMDLVNTQVYEIGGTYVVQGPHRRRLTTTVEAGASMLDFAPNANQSQTTSIRPAAIVGVGAEYALTKRFSLRAGYRAQIYKGPAFSNIYTVGAYTTTNTVFSSNPILGFTYRLGRANTD